MDQLAESCLSLDESIGDTLLSAESRQEDHHLDGLDVVSNNNELCFLVFDQLGNVVQTEFKHNGLGASLGFVLSISDLGLSFLLESGFLVLLGLGGVLCKQLEESGSYKDILIINIYCSANAIFIKMAANFFLKILHQLSLTLVSVNSSLELVNGRGNLKSLEEDSLLSLNPNVFGPSDESGEVSLGLDVASDSEVAGVLLEEGALALGASGLGCS